eukprot:5200878-Pleurochrysis_carterae.AAC.2
MERTACTTQFHAAIAEFHSVVAELHSVMAEFHSVIAEATFHAVVTLVWAVASSHKSVCMPAGSS